MHTPLYLLSQSNRPSPAYLGCPTSWAHLAGAGVGQSHRLHPLRNGGWRPEKPHESTVPLLRQGPLHLGSLLQARAIPEDLRYEKGLPQ